MILHVTFISFHWNFSCCHTCHIVIYTHTMNENQTSCTQYDTPTKNKFIGAVTAGKSIREAGHIFSIKKSSAHHIWNKYKSSRSTRNLQCSGHPKKVLDQTKCLVVRTATAHHRKPFQEIANEMLPKISKSTVQNLLAKEGYHRWAVRKVPYLTKKHQIDHMHWAQFYKMFNWDKVIMSDESYIYLGDDHGKIYVTRRTNEELNENCLVLTFKQSSVHVMIWACLMKGRKGPLIVLEYLGGRGGGMNSTQYKDQVLEGVLASFYAKVAQEMGKCHETTAGGGTLLESIVLGVELCIVHRSQQGLDEPACDVLVVLSRLLLVVFLYPKSGTGILDKTSSDEEL